MSFSFYEKKGTHVKRDSLERCESCWQGGNLRKKRSEKDLSSSGNTFSEHLSRQRVEEPL